MATFTQRDPLTASFWDQRFAQNFMPWDQGGVPIEFSRMVQSRQTPLRTLIPGCGLGHEVRCLAQAGWNVTAIDFSPVAVANARAALGEFGSLVQQADFFSYVPPHAIELIYERAFLCALPQARWPSVVQRYAELLPPDGVVAGYFYYDDAPKGPPFGADRKAFEALMAAYFVLIDDAPAEQSIPVFAGKERWQRWQRRSADAGTVRTAAAS